MEMSLKGYHGTSRENAESILRQQAYHISKGPKHWLGDGIYFYFNPQDAQKWCEKIDGEVLCSTVECNRDECLHLNTEEGRKFLRDGLKLIENIFQIKLSTQAKDTQQNQCALINTLWKCYPKLMVVIGQFPTVPRKKGAPPLLSETRTLRWEFCVRNNERISQTYLLKRECYQ